MSLYSVADCVHGHDSVSACAACRASNKSTDGSDTLTEIVLVAMDE